MAAKRHSKSAKVVALLAEGTFNPAAARVRDPKFRAHDFFDPRDLVQVKYELLRRVSLEQVSVTAATAEYGVSRPTYYQAKAHFATGGIAGLVPRKRGPRGPHKLHGEAWAFVEQHLVAGEPVRARALAKQLRQHFALTIHPRTIERAVAGKKTAR
ncbi:MAG: helix-turn-helix domain-containing protein [Candidatus Binatia bacterium]